MAFYLPSMKYDLDRGFFTFDLSGNISRVTTSPYEPHMLDFTQFLS